MSSKLTELTESSPSALPQSTLCGSGILSWLASPWSMASSGNFDPGQAYDGYNAVEGLDSAFNECLAKGSDWFQHFNPKSQKCHFCFVGKKPCCCPGPVDSNIRRYLWSKKDGPFGKEVLVSEGATPDVTSEYSDFGGRAICSSSAVPISRINNEGLVKQIRQISNYPADPDAECSDESDGEEVEVVNNPVGHQFSNSPSQPPAKRFQIRLITSTPRNSQPTFSTIPTSLPPASPSSSHSRPAIIPAVRPPPFKSTEIHP
ncbi:hypothetical protein O181_060887 [Austropuccinia psidii MF-1]|uniref:Uncharacterized protein n=1 Tax=Austropuccinia psidii MF-1 TaxID=1389203 RepID=A0A9Q3HYU9_9BASI|nr:hypothetical protein [Austropuccinia psidii MF-1]